MNQEYVLLGGWWWRLTGKKIGLWRNHRQGSWLTRLAVLLSEVVFCTSPHSYTARFKKTKIMPVGVDTEFFYPRVGVSRDPHSILALGRISPVKRLDILVAALLELQKSNINFTATIVGSPLSAADRAYDQKLRRLARPLTEIGRLIFQPAVSPAETPAIYSAHSLYVNLTPSGSMDKTIFEAMACQDLVLRFESGNSSELASEIKHWLEIDPVQQAGERLKFRQLALTHDLAQTISQISYYFYDKS
jgi:glycosyltransferase involved in cell wall biosynthesis